MSQSLAGSLSTYLASEWSLTGDLHRVKIHFPGTVNEDWYEERKFDSKQIAITQLVAPRLGHFSSGAVMTASYLMQFEVNIWIPIRAGAKGTAQTRHMSQMAEEVVRVFVKGHPNYGGSLSPFGGVFPRDAGRPLTIEIEEHTPMLMRYQIVLEATRYR